LSPATFRGSNAAPVVALPLTNPPKKDPVPRTRQWKIMLPSKMESNFFIEPELFMHRSMHCIFKSSGNDGLALKLGANGSISFVSS
jgi:hypothetical protein